MFFLLYRLVWVGKMSVYYFVCSMIRFANGFAYWTLFTIDHVLRSMLRTWYRLLALAKSLVKVVSSLVSFVAVVTYRLFLVIIMPVAAIVASGSGEDLSSASR